MMRPVDQHTVGLLEEKLWPPILSVLVPISPTAGVSYQFRKKKSEPKCYSLRIKVPLGK